MNYQLVAVTLVLGHWSVKYTLKRMMRLNKVKVSREIKYFLLKLLTLSKQHSLPSHLSWPSLACLSLCGNGFPVWFGSGRRWALGFVDNILLPACGSEFLSVFIAHFVVGSCSGMHDKFARLYAVNSWLTGLKADDCMLWGCLSLYFRFDFIGLVRSLYYWINFRLTVQVYFIEEDICTNVWQHEAWACETVQSKTKIPSTPPKNIVNLSLRWRTIQLIKSQPVHCVPHLQCPEIRQIYGLLYRVDPCKSAVVEI